ncbi:MAG: response regulator [Polyangiaceae bacterium]|nr:response regulator [Polyangiaceae bacterium]
MTVPGDDRTDLGASLDALLESQAQLRVVLDATQMGIWVYDPAAQGSSWDATTRRIFGVGEDIPAPTLAAMMAERIHPEDRRLVSSTIETAMQTGAYGPIEHRIVLPHGSVRWVAASGKTVEKERGATQLVGSVVDITERRALEARARDAEKLESIGRLAGGIAHDFNDMLTSMIGNVDILLREPKTEGTAATLHEIRLAAERSAALTAQLLAFAKRQSIEPRLVAPSEIVARLEPLLRRLIGEHIVVSSAFGARGRVRIDPSQLEQILLNLATNARDAMPTGGRLGLETSDLVIDERSARGAGVEPGVYVVIAVTDTGSGISQEALPHIFEPFFSTRPGGTGLGLATCYGIAHQNGGHLRVDSEPHKGTTFRVYLPTSTDSPPSATRTSAPRTTQGGGESILLVEDEGLVRRVLERTLAIHGYRVRAVASAAEALDVAAREGPFQVLVTDVVMPGLGGPQLAERLLAFNPSMSVLYISGYTETTLVEEGAFEPGRRFLQKPFLAEDLLVAVRALIEA